MVNQKYSFLYKFWHTNRFKNNLGISLTELLVTIVIGGIAISGLLAAMVELLRTDQQEAAREETQQEMQAALSFIAEDLRESVYVYDGTQTRNTSPTDNTQVSHNVLSKLPNFGTGVTPIIVFWKAEQLSATQLSTLQSMNCNSFATTPVDKKAECENLKLKRRAYSLVVYLQSTVSDPQWKGKSRILRYELPKYVSTTSGFASLTHSTGFVDPGENNNFPTWPFDSNGNDLQGGTLPTLAQSPPEVLVDFVDAPNSTAASVPDCPSTNYSRLPSNATSSNSFFTCVRTIGNALGRNQDIILYLRGNAEGKGGTIDKNYLPTQQTSVTLRGVIDKFTPNGT